MPAPLTLLLPGWLCQRGIKSLKKDPRTKKTLSRAKKSLLRQGVFPWILRAFSVEKEGLAPFAALADGLDAQKGFWAMAAPVHMDPGQASIQVRRVNLEEREAQDLISALDAHFRNEGLFFFAPDPNRWYAQAQESPQVAFLSLSQLKGDDLRESPFSGEGKKLWARWWTEAQMLLAAHPVNRSRLERGLTPVSGVWFEEGGSYFPPRSPFAKVFADEPWGRGLALASGTPFFSLPQYPFQRASPSAPDLLIFQNGQGLEEETLRQEAQFLGRALAAAGKHWQVAADFQGEGAIFSPSRFVLPWRKSGLSSLTP